MIIEMPVEQIAAQTFTVQLVDVKYKLDIQWNDRGQYFTMSIADGVTGISIADGLALVLGVDLLGAYNFQIGSFMTVDTSGQGQEATLDNFGVQVKLYWFSEDETNGLV